MFRHVHAFDSLRGHSKLLQSFEDNEELPKYRIYQQSLSSFGIDLFQFYFITIFCGGLNNININVFNIPPPRNIYV